MAIATALKSECPDFQSSGVTTKLISFSVILSFQHFGHSIQSCLPDS